MSHPLDNPVWGSLTSRHAAVALGDGAALRYPAETAPFVAVAEPGVDPSGLVQMGESVVTVGGPVLAGSWETTKEFLGAQMVWDGRVPEPQAATPLGEEDIPAMLELTALAYPHYFRPGTARLGPYFGVWEHGRLVAMAGVRMAMPGWQELSAVCTHPDHRGRGLASMLSLHVVRQILEDGDVPFLHTESDNPAREMYRKLGFSERTLVPIRVLQLRERA